MPGGSVPGFEAGGGLVNTEGVNLGEQTEITLTTGDKA